MFEETRYLYRGLATLSFFQVLNTVLLTSLSAHIQHFHVPLTFREEYFHRHVVRTPIIVTICTVSRADRYGSSNMKAALLTNLNLTSPPDYPNLSLTMQKSDPNGTNEEQSDLPPDETFYYAFDVVQTPQPCTFGPSEVVYYCCNCGNGPNSWDRIPYCPECHTLRCLKCRKKVMRN